ncbi:CDP-diacylglycerol--glycerol-3-phosphate 3-phosphatidyltransferase, mitochondrial [Takifugu flavidus]|uniref:CDP-diacylglycerol--glycerol-3-phosphate 3-phosphatidyltransferase, mitochondrial n=1 Tax=Takifugu flavidus TaxID=433684 RepID=A0A5C6MEY1_9TELE|nr:CDP-diacylglycerol--glycerol-3-phosphate 3-phosphatidyltransferase, mitochondrial [Takifugu flavidus]
MLSELRTFRPRVRADPGRLGPLTVCSLGTGDRQQFSVAARRRIMEVLDGARARQRDGEGEELSEGEEDTWVFPLVQMKPLGIQVDEEVTQEQQRLYRRSTEVSSATFEQ